MENACELKVYDLSIMYPKEWNIYIHPTIPFLYSGGSLKLENVRKEKDGQASLGIRWTETPKDINIDDYVEELKLQYSKKQNKRKEFYEVISTEEVSTHHKAYLIYSDITSNHGIFGIMTPRENLSSLQLAIYCKDTSRIVVATITADKSNLKENYDYYKKMLLTLTCH